MSSITALFLDVANSRGYYSTDISAREILCVNNETGRGFRLYFGHSRIWIYEFDASTNKRTLTHELDGEERIGDACRLIETF